MLQIKYESAKSIWQIYKKQGRKFNMKAQFLKYSASHAKFKRKYIKSTSQGSENTLLQFDRSCAQLRQRDTECKASETDYFVQFSSRLLKLQQEQRQRQQTNASQLIESNKNFDYIEVARKKRKCLTRKYLESSQSEKQDLRHDELHVGLLGHLLAQESPADDAPFLSSIQPQIESMELPLSRNTSERGSKDYNSMLNNPFGQAISAC